MSDAWLIVVLLTLATMAIRVSGPVLTGHRELPAWAVPVISVLPGALLTALIVIQVLTDGDKIVVDERLIGLAAAGLVLWRRRDSVILTMLAAAVVVAAFRALT